MNDIIEKDNTLIEDKIYIINGIQVMTDFDLSRVYKVETKRINEAVKNNPKKFPRSFSWRLSDEESQQFLVENFDQKSIETRGGRYKNPRVFSERGIIMLSTILKSNVAIEMSIQITDAFVKMRHFIIDNKDVYKSITNINEKIVEHDKRLDYLFSKFDRDGQLFLENSEYDAYSSFVSIFKLSKNELIIIDSYADNTLLDIIRKLKCKIILITKNGDRLNNDEILKYNKQYTNLLVIRNNSFHDRYFIIDRKDIFSSGTSINNAGEKIFSINKISDDIVKNMLLEYIGKIINT